MSNLSERTEVKVNVEDLENEAKKMQIYNLDSFYKSELFKNNFEKRGRVITQVFHEAI